MSLSGFPRYLKNSVAVRLLVMFIFAGILSVVVMWLTLDVTFERHFNREIQPHLSRFLTSIRHRIGTSPNLTLANTIAKEEDLQIIIEGASLMWSSNRKFPDSDKFIDKSIRFDRAGGMSRIGNSIVTGFYDERFMQRHRSRGYTVTIIMNKRTTYLRFEELITTIALILTVVLLLYWFIRRLFSPLKVINQGVKKIGDGKFTHRLYVNREDEFSELATSVNKMADNIELMLQAKQQMLLAISHELRTPITRARLALSMMDYSGIRDSIEDDLKEMEFLVQELLETERLKSTHDPLVVSKVDVNQLINMLRSRYFIDTPLKLTLHEPSPVVGLDEKRISLVIKNIIKNALTARKSREDEIEVKTRIKGGALIICVIDQGVGIAKKDIPLLTEPFFRADVSRQRKTGGYGIGLYLIKLIVEAHNGQLIIESEQNVGTCVEVIIPLDRKKND